MNLNFASPLRLLTATALLIASFAAQTPSQQTALKEPGVLQLTISLDHADSAQLKTPKFRVELRNTGDSDLVVNLGITLANGKKQFPKDIVLLLIDSQGKSRALDLKEPAYVAGRVDPLIVPLPAGAAFSLPVDLNKYWAAASQEFDYRLQPGSYSLEAQFSGRAVTQQEANLDVKGIALMPYWTGAITSNRLQFEIPKP